MLHQRMVLKGNVLFPSSSDSFVMGLDIVKSSNLQKKNTVIAICISELLDPTVPFPLMVPGDFETSLCLSWLML